MRNSSAFNWMPFLKLILDDSKLNVWHLSLLVAIILLADDQSTRQNIRVSRGRLMSLSHICTLPTFHKYFTQLQEYGYIRYRPSYHPAAKSTVDIIYKVHKMK